MITASTTDEVIGRAKYVESPLQVLLRLAATAQVYRSADGGLHAEVPIGGRQQIQTS